MLTDAAERQYQAGPPRAVDNKVTQAVTGALPNGEYTVGWRVVSADGHPVSGSYTFTVRGSSGGAQPAAPAPSTTKAASSEDSGGSSGWLWIGLIALVLAVAAAWSAGSAAPPPPRTEPPASGRVITGLQ